MDVILFDGECNLCNGFVQYVLKRDKKAQFKFASLHSTFGKEFLKEKGYIFEDFNSIALYSPGNYYYIKSEAFIEINKKLGFPWSMVSVFYIIPRFIRDFFYTLAAKNRIKIGGKADTCWVMTPELKDRFIVD